MHKHVGEKYVPTILFTVLLIVLAFLLYPYFVPILGAVVLTILFKPLFSYIQKKIKSQAWSAGITCIFVLLVIFIPILFIIQLVFRETTLLLGNVYFRDSLIQIQSRLVHFFAEFSYVPINMSFVIEKAVSIVGSFLQELLVSLPSKALFVFVTFFLFYYFLKDNERITRFIFRLFVVSDARKASLLKQLKRVTYGVVYGQIITAILQGFVATIGYVIFGVPLPFLMGFMTIFFAFIPVLGTGIVWFPLAIIMMMQGNFFGGIGLLVYGVLVISIVDNAVRPRLISGKAELHPALVLLGVVSGLNAFGILGLFIGPLFIAAGKQLLLFYVEDGKTPMDKPVKNESKQQARKSQKTLQKPATSRSTRK